MSNGQELHEIQVKTYTEAPDARHHQAVQQATAVNDDAKPSDSVKRSHKKTAVDSHLTGGKLELRAGSHH